MSKLRRPDARALTLEADRQSLVRVLALERGDARASGSFLVPVRFHTLRTQRAAARGRPRSISSVSGEVGRRTPVPSLGSSSFPRSSSTRAATGGRSRIRRRDRQPSVGHDSRRRRIDRNAAPRPRGNAPILRFTRDAGVYSRNRPATPTDISSLPNGRSRLLDTAVELALCLPSGLATDQGSAALRRRSDRRVRRRRTRRLRQPPRRLSDPPQRQVPARHRDHGLADPLDCLPSRRVRPRHARGRRWRIDGDVGVVSGADDAGSHSASLGRWPRDSRVARGGGRLHRRTGGSALSAAWQRRRLVSAFRSRAERDRRPARFRARRRRSASRR